MPLTEEEALALLNCQGHITYDQLDDVFHAFGFSSEFELPNVTWYFHDDFDCGEFKAHPRYDFSTLTEEQVAIVRTMILRLRTHRG